MISALPIPTTELIRLLAEHYGLEVASVVPLALGHGNCGTARVETRSEQRYFLKCKREVSVAGLGVSSLLRSRRLAVVAPVPTTSEALYVRASGFHLVLYPFLDASSVDFSTLLPGQWQDLGRLLREVHNTVPPKDLRAGLLHEEFVPHGEKFLQECARVLEGAAATPERAQLQLFWQANGSLIQRFYSMARQQGRDAQRAGPILHLCHNDFHSDNILMNFSAGELTLVDWDHPAWRPRERDLLFVAPEYRAHFEAGYGPLDQLPEVALYMEAEWLLGDCLDCIDRLLAAETHDTERAWAFATLAILIASMRALLEREAKHSLSVSS